jgi:hypothetical protein
MVLDLGDIDYERPPAVWYEVYVNLPPSEAPLPHGPYFAGNLAFFAVAPHHHAAEEESGRVELEVTGVLDRQARQGLWTGGEVRVTFVCRGAEGAPVSAEERPVRIGRVRIIRR